MYRPWLLIISTILLLTMGCDDQNNGVSEFMDTVSEATETDNFENRSLSDEQRVTLFATCMRGNGLPVGDPELNSDNSIKWDIIKRNIERLSLGSANSSIVKASLDECYHHLDGVILTRPLDKEEEVAQQDRLLEYTGCLRENGIDVDDPVFYGSARESMKTDFAQHDWTAKIYDKAMRSCKQQIYANVE